MPVTENREKAAILYKAIDKLPETQKIAFLLSETAGLSYAEISEITGSSVSSIESMLFRARKNLRGMLADFYKKQG
jgi:RNA polymerase sigma factor (sigma-70 family)